MVATMGRVRLDRFTRDVWKRFDHRDLEPLKWAKLQMRRREAAEGLVVAVVGAAAQRLLAQIGV